MNDEPTIEWRISTGESGTPVIFGTVTGFGLNLFKWNHVALTFNAATKQLMVFVNGVTGVSTTLMISQFGSFAADHIQIGADVFNELETTELHGVLAR